MCEPLVPGRFSNRLRKLNLWSMWCLWRRGGNFGAIGDFSFLITKYKDMYILVWKKNYSVVINYLYRLNCMMFTFHMLDFYMLSFSTFVWKRQTRIGCDFTVRCTSSIKTFWSTCLMARFLILLPFVQNCFREWLSCNQGGRGKFSGMHPCPQSAPPAALWTGISCTAESFHVSKKKKKKTPKTTKLCCSSFCTISTILSFIQGLLMLSVYLNLCNKSKLS